jgi:hypothetical protein
MPIATWNLHLLHPTNAIIAAAQAIAPGRSIRHLGVV